MATSKILAGSDTTAIRIHAINWCPKAPGLQGPSWSLRSMSCVPRTVFSDPLQLAEADGMPYLQAFMYEVPPLHPWAIGRPESVYGAKPDERGFNAGQKVVKPSGRAGKQMLVVTRFGSSLRSVQWRRCALGGTLSAWK